MQIEKIKTTSLSLFFHLSGRLPDADEMLQKEDTVRLKRCIYATQRDTLPPITTHNVVDDATDPVLNSFRRCRLFNEKSDRVKVCIEGPVTDTVFQYSPITKHQNLR